MRGTGQTVADSVAVLGAGLERVKGICPVVVKECTTSGEEKLALGSGRAQSGRSEHHLIDELKAQSGRGEHHLIDAPVPEGAPEAARLTSVLPRGAEAKLERRGATCILDLITSSGVVTAAASPPATAPDTIETPIFCGRITSSVGSVVDHSTLGRQRSVYHEKACLLP